MGEVTTLASIVAAAGALGLPSQNYQSAEITGFRDMRLASYLWFEHGVNQGREFPASPHKAQKLTGISRKQFQKGIRHLNNADLLYATPRAGSKLIVQGEMAMQNINGQFTPFTGTAIYYYENGTVHKQHVYVDGLMEGKSQWWHENGTKAGEAVKKQGKWDGAYMEWHENGLPKVKATYKDGAMAGVAIKFHENGRIAERATFADGKPVSLQAFDEQGQPIKKK